MTTDEKLNNMVYVIGENTINSLLASRIYAAKFTERRHSDERALKKLRDRFERNKSEKYKKQKRQVQVTNEEKKFFVLGSLVENPYISIRQLGRQLDFKKSSL